MQMERIIGAVRRAIDDYDMIAGEETIAVGVSGGKDSMTLLTSLVKLSAFHPKKFHVVGIMLDMDFPKENIDSILEYASEIGADLRVVHTDIKKIVFDVRQESNPCSLCANLRRGALNNEALKLNISKIALGHHFDDVVETFLMNLLNEGRLGCFSPVTYLDRKQITVIRPMIYVKEKEIINAVKRNNIPVMKVTCLADGYTERTRTKELLVKLEKEYPNIKESIFGALQRRELDGWKLFPRGRKIN